MLSTRFEMVSNVVGSGMSKRHRCVFLLELNVDTGFLPRLSKSSPQVYVRACGVRGVRVWCMVRSVE